MQITSQELSLLTYDDRNKNNAPKKRKKIDNNVLVDIYKKTKSIRQVALNLGISHETVRYKLKALGVLNKPLTKYYCNEDFFSLNTPESFYWAGFIAADGCVKLKDKKYKQLSIDLMSSDKKHIEKFKEAICFAGPINCRNNSTGICISSDKIFDDLSRFNIVQRKSLILTFPDWMINHHLVNHFMRGYNDGDGSFYYALGTNKLTPQAYFSLRGTNKFLTSYKCVLEEKCGFSANDKKPRLNSGIYTLEYGGNSKVRKIRDFLYLNSNNKIRLDRKYNLIYGVQNGI